MLGLYRWPSVSCYFHQNAVGAGCRNGCPDGNLRWPAISHNSLCARRRPWTHTQRERCFHRSRPLTSFFLANIRCTRSTIRDPRHARQRCAVPALCTGTFLFVWRGEMTAKPHRERSKVLAFTTEHNACSKQIAKLNNLLNMECKHDVQLCLFTTGI